MSYYFGEYFIQTDEEMKIYDITEKIKESVLESKILEGHLLIQPLHTTVGIYLNENEERLLQKDIPRELNYLYPNFPNRYKHDDISMRRDCAEDEPLNGHSHLKAMFCSNPSLSLIIHEGKLSLGKYQRILFAEFDGPCPRNHKSARNYLVSILGE